MAHDYPTRGKLATLVKAHEEEKEETRLGSLQIPSSIKSKKGNKPKGLMFADVTIRGTTISALLDTGVSDFFISEEVAKKLNLPVEKGAGWLKIVNSQEVSMCNMAKDVEVHIE